MLDGIFSKICLVMLVIMIFMGIEIYTQHLKLENYEIKEKSVEQIGIVQDANAKKENKESKTNKGEVENEYAVIITGMHIDAERLRNQIARGSKLPRTPQVCTGGSETATVNWPDINSAITRYRSRVRGLVEQGTESTAALNAVKLWISKETE